MYKKRDNIKEQQKEINKLFLDKSLKNSYTMREQRLKKELEKQGIGTSEEKMKKYFTEEQRQRDKVLRYLLSI